MIYILKYWKQLGLIAIIGILYATAYFHGHTNGLIKGRKLGEKALKSQESILKAECEKEKQLTTEVSNEYQNKLSDLDKQLTAAKLRGNIKASCITPIYTTGYNPAAKGGQSDKRNGITTDSLYDFAGQCEKDRIQLISCQSFITKVWQLKTPN